MGKPRIIKRNSGDFSDTTPILGTPLEYDIDITLESNDDDWGAWDEAHEKTGKASERGMALGLRSPSNYPGQSTRLWLRGGKIVWCGAACKWSDRG